MSPCRWPGQPCPHEATVVVRISDIGDRRVCAEHLAVMERLGMDFRRLDESQPLPEWRTRSLARDMTGAYR